MLRFVLFFDEGVADVLVVQGRRRGYVQFLDNVVTCPLLRRQVHEGVAGAVPAVVDVPVYAATWGLAHSAAASDSVHRAD